MMDRFLRTFGKLLMLALFFTLFSETKVFGQNQVGLYYTAMTMHLLGDKNAKLMPYRLDDRGLLVLNAGGALQYRKQLKGRWTVDAVQSFQADCAFKASWGTGISLGFNFIKSPAHQLILAMGPGFFVRENWADLDGYLQVEELKISKNKKWEYLFAPVVPHAEYAWFPHNKNLGISIYCVFDPINVLGNVGFGLDYKLKK